MRSAGLEKLESQAQRQRAQTGADGRGSPARRTAEAASHEAAAGSSGADADDGVVVARGRPKAQRKLDRAATKAAAVAAFGASLRPAVSTAVHAQQAPDPLQQRQQHLASGEQAAGTSPPSRHSHDDASKHPKPASVFGAAPGAATSDAAVAATKHAPAAASRSASAPEAGALEPRMPAAHARTAASAGGGLAALALAASSDDSGSDDSPAGPGTARRLDAHATAGGETTSGPTASALDAEGDAAPRTTPDAALSIQDLERRLRSHGPYVRIYAPQQQDSASGRLAADQAQGSPSGNGAPAQPQRAGPQSSSAAPAALAGAIPGLDVTFGTAKDLTVLDVTPSKGAASPSKFAAYPTVIRTPQSMGRVSIGASFNIPRAASPSPMTLARPVSSRSGPRYARSNSASRSSHAQDYSHRTGGDDNEMSPQQQMLAEEMLSTPFLPFLTLTNSLQLYLKLAVLDDSERIICWNPGSFLLQTSPFVGMPGTSANSTPRQSAAARLFSISAIRSLVRSMSARDETAYPAAPPTSPGYLLLTSSAVYIFRPIFSLYSLKLPLKDEQTTYLDPSALLQLVCKFPHSDIVRLDVGPSRQHLCFRVRQLPSGTAALSPSALIPAQTTSGTTPAASPQPSVRSNGAAASSALSGSKPLRIKIDSWVFLARSRMCTNQIVEYLTASLHEMLAEHVMPSQSAGLVNQDIEPVLRNLQASVFLRPGRKDVRVLTYEHVWPTPRSSESEQPKSSNGGGSVCVLAESESDPAADAEITKVDFDFLRFYLLGCFMRYIRPVPELPARSVKLEHVSIVGTAVYIYLVSERFDVWPPLIVPDEFSPHPSVNARIEGVSQLAPLDASGKGLTADIVPEFEHVLGVGRVADILRVERWRTWRIDAALGLPGEPPCEDLRGLGEALQNGYLGFVGADASKMGIAEQHGSAGGWLWWVRIVFGERDPEADSLEQPATPVSAPRSIPTTTGGERVGFWWDLAFSNRDAVDELLDAIRRLRAHPGASYEDQMHTNGDSLEGHIEQPQAAPQAPQLPQARQIPPPSIILGDD